MCQSAEAKSSIQKFPTELLITIVGHLVEGLVVDVDELAEDTYDPWSDEVFPQRGRREAIDSAYESLYGATKQRLGALGSTCRRLRWICRETLFKYSAEICRLRHSAFDNHTCPRHSGDCCSFLDEHGSWYNSTALESAVAHGDDDTIGEILGMTRQTCTLQHLSCAVREGHGSTVRLLMGQKSVQDELKEINREISSKFEASWVGDVFVTPSHPVFEAILRGDVQLVREFLQKDGVLCDGSELIPTHFRCCRPGPRGRFSSPRPDALEYPETPIDFACNVGNPGLLRLFLELSNVTDEQVGHRLVGRTLQAVVHEKQEQKQLDSSGYVECLQHLLGLWPNLGRSFEHLTGAAFTGIREMYDLFKDVDPSHAPWQNDLTVAATERSCPLYGAMTSGNIPMVRDLLIRGATTMFPQSNSSKRRHAITYIYDAEEKGAECLHELIEHQIRTGVPLSSDTFKWKHLFDTALINTVLRYNPKNKATVESLVKLGATLQYDLNYLDHLSGDPELAEILLRPGAELTRANASHRPRVSGQSYLDAYRNTVSSIEREFKSDYCRYVFFVALQACVKWGVDEPHWSSARLDVLIDHGALQYCKDGKSFSAMRSAILNCDRSAVDTFLRRGARSHGFACPSEEPLHNCINAPKLPAGRAEDRVKILERLLYAGAKASPKGRNLILLALESTDLGPERARIVELLLVHGVRPPSTLPTELKHLFNKLASENGWVTTAA